MGWTYKRLSKMTPKLRFGVFYTKTQRTMMCSEDSSHRCLEERCGKWPWRKLWSILHHAQECNSQFARCGVLIGSCCRYWHQISDKKTTKDKMSIWAPSSRIQSTMVGKSQKQELEAAGHIAAAVKKHRAVKVDVQPSSPFYIVWDRRVTLPTVKVCLTTSLQKIPHKQCLEVCFHGDSKSHLVGN